jgi:hypothetical protein
MYCKESGTFDIIKIEMKAAMKKFFAMVLTFCMMSRAPCYASPQIPRTDP